MSATFISYRRNDSAGHTGRLYDHLCKALGENSVFRDIDTIKPGADFVEAVREGIQRCSSLIVVIGNHWLTAEDDSGRRLDHPLDYVRLEIGSALKQGIQVIPVLVEGAKMPDPSDLPDEISPLAHRQALQLSDDRWDYDVSRLISALEKPTEKSVRPANADTELSDNSIGATADGTSLTQSQSARTRKPLIGIASTLLLIIVIGLAFWIWPEAEKVTKTTDNSEGEITQQEQRENSRIEKASTDKATELHESGGIAPVPESNFAHKEREIERLLILADENIGRLQLTAPGDDNAVEKYRRIIELHPGHPAALHGLEQVSRKYSELAMQAVESNKLNKAEHYLGLARSINADIPEIRQVEGLIKSTRQDQIERDETFDTTQIGQEQTTPASREKISPQLACRDSCQEKARECGQRIQTDGCPTPELLTQCEQVQRACLRDPQMILTWGEFASSAECLSRFNQCKDDKLTKCEETREQQAKICALELESCLHECR